MNRFRLLFMMWCRHWLAFVLWLRISVRVMSTLNIRLCLVGSSFYLCWLTLMLAVELRLVLSVEFFELVVTLLLYCLTLSRYRLLCRLLYWRFNMRLIRRCREYGDIGCLGW